MATQTFQIDHTMMGQVIGPPNAWLQSFEWVGQPPSRYETPVPRPDGSCWQNGYFTLRGEHDLWNLVSFDLSNTMRSASALNYSYRGGLLIAGVPFDTQWQITVSDQPVAARKAA